MIYVCGKPRGSFICFTKYKRQKQAKQPLGFPQENIISTKYKTQQQMKQSHLLLCFVFCSDDICLWETQRLFHLFLSFVFCSDDMLVGNLGIVSFVVVFCILLR
jgi:hypothetical protein